MAFEQIQYLVNGHVATITLNRPDKLNAWTSQMEQEVRSAIETAAGDGAVRAIVVTGAGRGFCAGADMNNLSGLAGGGRLEATPAPAERAANGHANGHVDSNFEQRFSYMLRIGKPIIAAINGPIAGIGLCFALFCDVRFMADGARLTTAFARRGLIAEHGMSWMLPRLVGTMNALDLLFSGRLVEAREAEHMGLARTLPAEGFLGAVETWAAELVTTSSPRSIGVMKRQVYDSYFQSLGEAWAYADEEMVKSFASEDFKEGVAHFVEKRAPAFTGR